MAIAPVVERLHASGGTRAAACLRQARTWRTRI